MDADPSDVPNTAGFRLWGFTHGGSIAPLFARPAAGRWSGREHGAMRALSREFRFLSDDEPFEEEPLRRVHDCAKPVGTGTSRF